eukprot:TRINITY_DN19803_c0_g1_i1.p1 TRINITY_DN19803_c0_g1~~TRINITY_DN19803_c0_g1_i1.p1  ORF type:complete len:906 (+),score=183.03 TRINITY_DN19803_c0_g1_i1:180-2897(+)
MLVSGMPRRSAPNLGRLEPVALEAMDPLVIQGKGGVAEPLPLNTRLPPRLPFRQQTRSAGPSTTHGYPRERLRVSQASRSGSCSPQRHHSVVSLALPRATSASGGGVGMALPAAAADKPQSVASAVASAPVGAYDFAGASPPRSAPVGSSAAATAGEVIRLRRALSQAGACRPPPQSVAGGMTAASASAPLPSAAIAAGAAAAAAAEGRRRSTSAAPATPHGGASRSTAARTSTSAASSSPAPGGSRNDASCENQSRPAQAPAQRRASARGSLQSKEAGAAAGADHPARDSEEAQPRSDRLLWGWTASLAAPRRKEQQQQPMEGQPGLRLLRSVFAGGPPVLFFDYEPDCGAPARDSRRVLRSEDLEAEGLSCLPKMQFRHDETKDCHPYKAVLNTLAHGGLARTAKSAGKFALFWGEHPGPDMLRSFNPYQRANHFPASWNLGRKDLLWRNVSKMKRKYPQQFDIMPAGFVLPDDFASWVSARESSPNVFWIWKPVNMSCGKGIQVLGSNVPSSTDKKLAQKAGVVQRYIHDPLLINGFKFDLRLYVVVTSFDPLKVYLGSEGLVRMATEQYDPSAATLGRRTMHLTNYSVNKHSEAYKVNLDQSSAARATASPTPADDAGDEDGAGAGAGEAGEGEEPGGDAAEPEAPAANAASASKWSLEQLRDYFQATGQDYELMMRRIKDLIIKTLLAVEPVIVNAWHQGANFSSIGAAPSSQAGPNQSCFEVYGFDVMVDKALKPWLLEVNIFPSFASSSPLDKRIKTQLISDALTLVGLTPFDHDLVDKATKDDNLKRLQGLLSSNTNASRSHTIATISSAASLLDLGEAEWKLILDTHDEYMRRGSLERLFPTEETVSRFAPFFSAPRYSNMVLARWLEGGGARCFLPEARGDVPPWLPRQIYFDPC